MKWNWGTKIAIFYSSFVVFTLFMVYMAFSEQYDLVTEDYYAEEIAYQGTIDSKQRTKRLKNNLLTTIEGKELKITFPNQGKTVEGSINCFRPSDESKDFQLKFLAENGTYSIPLEKFIRGKYTLKIEWKVVSDETTTSASINLEKTNQAETNSSNEADLLAAKNDESYYQEQIIIIP